MNTEEMNVLSGADLTDAEDGSSLWQDAWLRLKKNRAAVAGGVVLITMVILALLTPLIAPYSYEAQNLDLARLHRQRHWLGTDIFGRDLLTQILYGGRISLAVGFIATAVALVIGVTWGAVAGYVGGRVDAAMMRFVDILYALPFMIFIILLMVVFGRNILLLFLAIGAVEWLTMARIMRTQVQALRQRGVCRSGHFAGPVSSAIIFKHIIPNAIGPIIVYTTLTIPSVMLLEAFLSFLGLGIQPANQLGTAYQLRGETMESTRLLIFPGLALTITLFSLNFLGDGLRDALDVRGSKDDRMSLLNVNDLSVSFVTRNGTTHAVQNVSFTVEPKSITAIIGESGSGKSVSCYALLGLIPQPPGRIDSGTAEFEGRDLLQLSERELRGIRGSDIAMIFKIQ